MPGMNFPIPRWNKLYQMAEEIRDLAPWKKHYEEELFAIQPRAEGPVYFVSIMGNNGEHHAIAYYPGAESLGKFRLIQTSDDERIGLETILLNDHLQLAFEAKRDLVPPDLEILKALGKTYRGKWPAFRRHRAARLPWYPTSQELEDFEGLAEQTLEVLKRENVGESLLRPFDAPEFFLRRKAGAIAWEDALCNVDELPLPQHCLSVELPEGALAGLQRVDARFDVDLFLMPQPVDDAPEGEPPYFPFMLIVVDSHSGMIVGFDLIPTQEGVDAAMAQIPAAVSKVLHRVKAIPARMAARHPILCSALEAYGKAYGIKFQKKAHLPAVDEAIASAMSFMGGPMGF